MFWYKEIVSDCLVRNNYVSNCKQAAVWLRRRAFKPTAFQLQKFSPSEFYFSITYFSYLTNAFIPRFLRVVGSESLRENRKSANNLPPSAQQIFLMFCIFFCVLRRSILIGAASFFLQLRGKSSGVARIPVNVVEQFWFFCPQKSIIILRAVMRICETAK